MATTISVTDVTAAGITPTLAAAADAGNQFLNDGRVFIYIKNSGSAKDAIITAQHTSISKPGFGTLTAATTTLEIPATTGEKIFGPFPPGIFNDGNGYVQVTYEGGSATGLTIGAFRVPNL